MERGATLLMEAREAMQSEMARALEVKAQAHRDLQAASEAEARVAAERTSIQQRVTEAAEAAAKRELAARAEAESKLNKALAEATVRQCITILVTLSCYCMIDSRYISCSHVF